MNYVYNAMQLTSCMQCLNSCSIAAVSQSTYCFVSLLQRNLTEYFVAVDVNNMLHLYASMLYERRIIVCCSKLSTVSRIFYPPSQLSWFHCWSQLMLLMSIWQFLLFLCFFHVSMLRICIFFNASCCSNTFYI